ncbi:MAG: cytochrome c [Burkholderiales bacterium]|nr:cytochrome c [Burkholderiales bacterium]
MTRTRSPGPQSVSLSVSLRALLLASALVGGSAFAQGTAPVGNAEAGQAKASTCIGCHGIPGYKASFPNVYSVPMIAGQSAKYIEASLAAYRKGDRSHPTMRAIAGSLSDQDIADLAALYGSK